MLPNLIETENKTQSFGKCISEYMFSIQLQKGHRVRTHESSSRPICLYSTYFQHVFYDFRVHKLRAPVTCEDFFVRLLLLLMMSGDSATYFYNVRSKGRHHQPPVMMTMMGKMRMSAIAFN